MVRITRSTVMTCAEVSFGDAVAVLSVLGADAQVARAVDPMESATGLTLMPAQLEGGIRAVCVSPGRTRAATRTQPVRGAC